MTEHTVTKDLMLLCLADWRHSLTSPDVTPFAGKWAEHEEDAYNAIRSTLESHAALEKENAELRAELKGSQDAMIAAWNRRRGEK